MQERCGCGVVFRKGNRADHRCVEGGGSTRLPTSMRLRSIALNRLELLHRLSQVHGWVCWYCGKSLSPSKPLVKSDVATIDHILATSAGGTDDFKNLALCCIFCNRAKLNLPVDVFLEWLEFVKFSSRSVTRFDLADKR
jgi:hypothetical protein